MLSHHGNECKAQVQAADYDAAKEAGPYDTRSSRASIT
jgi:hypothetical protein